MHSTVLTIFNRLKSIRIGIDRKYRHTVKGIATIVVGINASTAQAGNQLPGIFGLNLQQLAELRITTASLFYSHSLDAPASVTVITQNEWQHKGARRMADALDNLAGVQILPALSGANAIAIRGYTRTTSLLGVANTWDGVPLGDFFRGVPSLILPNINLGALGEMQLIQGPGSALYGSDAFHGVLALKGFEANSSEQSITGMLYSDGYFSMNYHTGISVSEDSRISLAISASEQPDQNRVYRFVDPVTGSNREDERDNYYQGQTISTKFTTAPQADLVFDGGIYLHRYRSEDFQGFGTRLSGVRDHGGIDTDFVMTRFGARRKLSENRSLSLSAFYWLADSSLTAGREMPSVFDFESVSKQHRYGFQLQWRDAIEGLGTRWAVVAGSEEMAVKNAETNTFTENGAAISAVTNPAEGSSRHLNSITFEANTTWANERWRMIYGARYDHYSDFGGQTSPRLGLIYHPSENSAIKLLYGNAFRAPTANELHGTPGLVAGNFDLLPELIDTYELIFMRRTRHYFSQVVFFASRWEDGIVSVASDGAEPFTFENLERNHAKGMLLNFKRDFNPWLLTLDVAWVESENETLDQRYTAYPKYTLDIGIRYQSDTLNTEFTLTQSLRFETDDVFQPSAGLPAERLPTFRRTDLSSSTPLSDQVTLRFFIHNLFDEDNFRPSTGGSRGGIPDEPFTLGVALGYSL